MSIPRNDDHPPPKLDFQVVALVRTPERRTHRERTVQVLYPSPFTPQARAATRVSSCWHPESLRGCGGDEAGAVLGSFRTDTRVIDMGLVDPALTGTKRARQKDGASGSSGPRENAPRSVLTVIGASQAPPSHTAKRQLNNHTTQPVRRDSFPSTMPLVRANATASANARHREVSPYASRVFTPQPSPPNARSELGRVCNDRAYLLSRGSASDRASWSAPPWTPSAAWWAGHPPSPP